MNKILKTLQNIAVIGCICLMAPNSVNAFGLMPPTTFTPVIDIPQAAALITKGGNLKDLLGSVNLSGMGAGFVSGSSGNIFNVVKGFAKNFSKNFAKDKNTSKTPGKGEIRASQQLGISENDKNEAHYFDAYQKLFFIYPSFSDFKSVTEHEGIIQKAYKGKAVEYKQDIIVDTYFAGMLTERYLILVEKTIDRLERCQNGQEKDLTKCVFFGLQVVEIPSYENVEEIDPDNNPGLLAQANNVYIISTIYDRLMRIVENLTAAEAIYRAAKQIDLVEPISVDESDAEKYIPKTFNFANRDVHQSVYTTAMVNKKNKSDCFDAGGKGCSNYNSTFIELDNMDEAGILNTLQSIENDLKQAMIFHNLKLQMPQYKTQYRKYLKIKEMHERAKKALENEEICATKFLKKYAANQEKIPVWGKPSDSSNHEERPEESISRILIEEYQKQTEEVIIGGNDYCQGYYEECPDGYKKGQEHCRIADSEDNTIYEDKHLFPCELDIMQQDKGDPLNTNEQDKEDSTADNLSNQKRLQDVTTSMDKSSTIKMGNDKDYLKSGSIDDMDLENSIKEEKVWRIGSSKLMELTEKGELKFNPWKDQQKLQETYLKQKYINIKNIILSVDQALASFRIASSKAGSATFDFDEKIGSAISAIANCVSIEDAVVKAKEEYCGDNEECNISITNEGEIRRTINDVTTVVGKHIVSMDDPESCYTSGDEEGEAGLTQGILSVSYLVKKYFSDELGQGKEDINDQVKELYKKANSYGRIVAQDKITDVMNARQKNEIELLTMIKNYETKQQVRKGDVLKIKARIMKYNEDLDDVIKLKNKATQELNRSNNRLTEIDTEINGEIIKDNDRMESIFEKRIKRSENDKAYKCVLEFQKMALEYERNSIQNKDKKWYCPSICEDIQKEENIELCTSVIPQYTIKLSEQMSLETPNTKLYVVIPVAEEYIATQNKIIDSYTSARKILKDEVEKIEKEIQEKAEEFAENYLKKANEVQDKIESENDKFIKFLEKDSRMENSQRKICIKDLPIIGCIERGNSSFEKDNLEATIVSVIAPKEINKNEDSGLKEIVKTQLNKIFDEKLGVENITQNLRIPNSFVVDEGIRQLLSLADTGGSPYTAMALVAKLKDKIIDIATDEIVNYIRQGDTIIGEEIAKAEEKIEKFREALGICENCQIPISETKIRQMSDRNEYIENPNDNKINIIEGHNQLVKNLRKAVHETELQKAGINLGDLFGIPDFTSTASDAYKVVGNKVLDRNGKNIGLAGSVLAYNADAIELGFIKQDKVVDETVSDGEYFVALPARGLNYLGKDNYEKGTSNKDENAGRDFCAPKEPLLNLPPLREVFYYSASDYEETPKSKGGKPIIAHLLNKKYLALDDTEEAKKWEYMPEVWRYILAQPNLRDDGKYQQTFVERSFSSQEIRDLIENRDIIGAKPEDYRVIISRAGTYPCQMGGRTYDARATEDSVGKMHFITRSMLNNIPSCLEIELYNKKPCNTYKNSGRGICHLLADHNKNNDDNQKDLGNENFGLYEKYSELGQFLNSNLGYQPLLKAINKYLTKKDPKNTIERQRADLATFKRNIFGSFLDLVNMEHRLQNEEETLQEEIMTTLKSLCSELHKRDQVVSTEDVAKENCDEECEAKRDELCAKYIFDNKGLALSAEDKNYGVAGEYNDEKYTGIDCTKPSKDYYYESLFCKLSEWKQSKLNDAENNYKKMLEESSKLDQQRTEERIENIKNFIEAFHADPNEVSLISTDSTKESVSEKVKTAKADRTVERQKDDEGLESLENQSQVVPYCPVYSYTN